MQRDSIRNKKGGIVVIDKEIDKLRDLEQELVAMKWLNAEIEILEKQKRKIENQRKKVAKLIKEEK